MQVYVKNTFLDFVDDIDNQDAMAKKMKRRNSDGSLGLTSSKTLVGDLQWSTTDGSYIQCLNMDFKREASEDATTQEPESDDAKQELTTPEPESDDANTATRHVIPRGLLQAPRDTKMKKVVNKPCNTGDSRNFFNCAAARTTPSPVLIDQWKKQADKDYQQALASLSVQSIAESTASCKQRTRPTKVRRAMGKKLAVMLLDAGTDAEHEQVLHTFERMLVEDEMLYYYTMQVLASMQRQPNPEEHHNDVQLSSKWTKQLGMLAECKTCAR